MPKVISFTTLSIRKVIIDIASKQVMVTYTISDDTGFYSRSGTAVFTRPLPAGMPDDWFLIPADRAQQVLDLVNDIRAALTNALLT